MTATVPRPGLILEPDIEQYPEGIILPIDKPYRWTSADVIRKIKWTAGRHFGKKNLKVGHAGTLDPLATGILLVCIGKATKLAETLQSHEKEYIAGVSFGAVTPSFDLEKEIDGIRSLDGVDEDKIRAVLPDFIGEQMQVAPLFSAKSVDGVRAYETARKLFKQGRMSEAGDLLKASRINISELELLSCRPYAPRSVDNRLDMCQPGGINPAPRSVDNQLDMCQSGGINPTPSSLVGTYPADNKFNSNEKSCRIHVADISGFELVQTEIRVRCSKGTYIRALARDLGESVGSGAFLHSLRRTRVGEFGIEDCLSMDDALAVLGHKSQ